MRLRYEIKTHLFVGEDRCLDPVSKPGDRPSKIGPSIDKPGAGPDVSIEIGGQLTRSIDICYFPYHPYLLVVRSIDTPLLSVGREGRSDGSDPTFLCLVRRATPFSIDIAGVGRRSPPVGVAPVTIIPAEGSDSGG